MALHLCERHQRVLLHLLCHKEKNIYSSVSVTIISMLDMLDTKEELLLLQQHDLRMFVQKFSSQ